MRRPQPGRRPSGPTKMLWMAEWGGGGVESGKGGSFGVRG